MLKAMASIVLLTAMSAACQVEMQEGYRDAEPRFYFDALNFRTENGGSRLDFYVQVPFKELQFLKSEGFYLAAYQVSLQLIDDDGNPALQESWNERAMTRTFDETLSNAIVSSTQRHFSVRPGKYSLHVSVTDSESNRTFAGKRGFDARDFSRGGISMSDVMLLHAASATSVGHTIVPNIQGNVISIQSSFPVFYEIYFPNPTDSARVTTRIFGEKNKLIHSHSEWISRGENIVKVFAEIPKDSLELGFYRLEVSLGESEDRNAPRVSRATRSFWIHFPELPMTVTNLDKAAEELMYIANSKSIDSIKKAPDMLTKEKRFIQFWRKYNPNQSSEKNPLMEVYYNRVAYANDHFSAYFAGWRTDMGMVYILLGPPNSIDRHPFEIDTKPYEVWYYYRRNRRFIFMDATGFGDYRLLNPSEGGYPPPSATDFLGM